MGLVQGYFAFSLNKIDTLFFGYFNLYRTNPVPNRDLLPLIMVLSFGTSSC
jgi:hypothetical protein